MGTTAQVPATPALLVRLKCGGMFRKSNVAELENENLNSQYNDPSIRWHSLWNSGGGEYTAMNKNLVHTDCICNDEVACQDCDFCVQHMSHNDHQIKLHIPWPIWLIVGYFFLCWIGQCGVEA